MSGCIGSILILFSDGLARGIHPPLDIPVGVIIAIIGVPYFLFLLRRFNEIQELIILIFMMKIGSFYIPYIN